MGKYHRFQDRAGRPFEAMIRHLYGRGCDAMYGLEDAAYLNGEREAVPRAEVESVEEEQSLEINEAGQESSYE